MNRKTLLKRFEDELRETRKNYEEGKLIPLEEFDWGLPMHIAEPREKYRIDDQV